MDKKILKILSIILLLLAVPLCVYADEGSVDGQVDIESIAFAEGETLQGTVSIANDGTPQYGETISADVSNITNNTGTLSYQWQRNGADIEGGTGDSYDLVQEDIGASITVNVNSSVELGTLTSGVVSASKADRAAPDAPTLSTKDAHSITLAQSAEYEYKLGSGSFASEPIFTGLTSNTTYSFYQRYAETATHNASASSSALSVTTHYVTLNNETCDISTLASGDEVIVSGSVTLTGTQSIIVYCDAGTQLTLNNVTINITSMSGECAIDFAGSGNKLILSGANKVYSGSSRAGIEATGALSISGSGTLYAKGGSNGAGIGGSNAESAGAISIQSGKITAVGGSNAAGIGGGNGGSGGVAAISGGTVFVQGSSDDIGGGNGGSQGSLSISGSSAVFLKNNSAPAAASSTHSLYSNESVSGGKAYGYTMPSMWAEGETVYAYINYCNVYFNTNGAGSISSQKVAAGFGITPVDDPEKKGLLFGGWFTDSAFKNAFDIEDDKVYSNTTLYARWDAKITISVGEWGSVTPNKNVVVTVGDDLVITCTPDDEYHVGSVTSSKNHSVKDNGDNTYTIKNITAADKISVVFDANNLLGVVTIKHDGQPEFGDELTAVTTGITNNPEGAELQYQWMRDGVAIDKATKDKYITVKDDIGHKISVQVSSPEKEGFVESSQTGKVQKAMKPAPRAPLLQEKSTTTITLFPVDGCEYMMEGDVWRDNNVYENLQPETEYMFYQRYAETDTYNASNPSFCVKITTSGFSVENLRFAQNEVRMNKGDIENAISVMQYYMAPKDAENAEVYWASSNEAVAIVDNTNGTITALSEGKTIITITAADTTNGVISTSCVLQVIDPSPADANAFLAGLSGKLTDIQGNALTGYTVVVYSNPIAVKTDSLGEFSIEFIPYTEHVLVVEDENAEEIGRFIINWSEGENYKANIDNEHNVINITYTQLTTAINLPIEVNKDFNDIDVKTVEGISFVNEEAEKEGVPKKLYVLILLGIIAACIIGVGYILYIGRIQKDEYYEEVPVEGYFEQTLLEGKTESTNNSRDEK